MSSATATQVLTDRINRIEVSATMAITAEARISHTEEGVADGLRRHAERCDLLIVGAEYNLETGVVDFFDGMED